MAFLFKSDHLHQRETIPMFRKLSGLLLILWACGISGCGNSYGTPIAVTGKITLAGQPVTKARIIFRSSDTKLPGELGTLVAELKPDGTYSIEKVYPSEYVVMLESTGGMDATKSAVPPPSPLASYGATSTLRAKVAADKKVFDFDLPASK